MNNASERNTYTRSHKDTLKIYIEKKQKHILKIVKNKFARKTLTTT